MPDRVIFLDIDGVLNHKGLCQVLEVKCNSISTNERFDPRCVAQLNNITGITGADIVICSTFRVMKSLKSIRELINDNMGVEADIIGSTPILDSRGEEIECYIKACRHNIDKLIILDDEDVGMGDMLRYLVKTDFDNGGLTEAVAEIAIDKLGIE